MERAQTPGALLDVHSTPWPEGGNVRPRPAGAGWPGAILFVMGCGLFASAAQAQTAALDCAKPTEAAQKAICKAPGLKRLDAEIARVYDKLATTLPAAGAAALKDDQAAFARARDKGSEQTKDLTARMRARLDFLANVRTDIPGGFAGAWRNVSGKLTVKPKGVDALDVAIETVDPAGSGWTCKMEGVGKRSAGGIVVEPDAKGAGAWSVKLTQRNRMIVVEQTKPEKGEAAFCKEKGSVEGAYFPVKGAGEAVQQARPVVRKRRPAPPRVQPQNNPADTPFRFPFF